jgi:hypothetical protein
MKMFHSVLMAAFLVAVPATLSGCPSQTPAQVIADIESGIPDAEMAIETIVSGVDAYFALHPNATLKAQIDGAVADALAALRTVSSSLVGVTSITDGNVQAALAAFSQAYNSLIQLIGQIGIQAGSPSLGRAALRTSSGTLIIPSPRLLQAVKPATIAATVAATPAK